MKPDCHDYVGKVRSKFENQHRSYRIFSASIHNEILKCFLYEHAYNNVKA